MPVKQIKNILWASSSVMGLALFWAIFSLFFSTQPQGKELTLPEIPEAPIYPPIKGGNMGYYSSIWKARVNTDPPVVKYEEVKEPDFLLRLKQGIKVIEVMSERSALLEYNRKNTTFGKGDPIQVGSLNVVMIELVPGEKIKFQDTQSKAEAWLEKEDLRNKENVRREEATQVQKVGENQWAISQKEGKELFQNYDQFVQELGLKLHRRSDGSVLGVRVRQITEESKAYQYGFRKDDIIGLVNKAPLDDFSPQKIQELSQSFKGSDEIAITLLRNRKKVTLKFKIR